MNIVGVTSCIAGLAHTPMAAKMLEKEGKRLGHQVKIEQQGAMGIMDRISVQDIAEADFVLIAADRTIEEEERFAGKTIVRVNISDAVKRADASMNKIEAHLAQSA